MKETILILLFLLMSVVFVQHMNRAKMEKYIKGQIAFAGMKIDSAENHLDKAEDIFERLNFDAKSYITPNSSGEPNYTTKLNGLGGSGSF